MRPKYVCCLAFAITCAAVFVAAGAADRSAALLIDAPLIDAGTQTISRIPDRSNTD